MKELLFKIGDVSNMPIIDERDDNTIYYAIDKTENKKGSVVSFGKDEIALKTDLENYYTKEEVDSMLQNIMDVIANNENATSE